MTPSGQDDSVDPVQAEDDGRIEETESLEPEWVRRRRLAAVFDDGAHGQSLSDDWYRDQVPPHHG